jgi:hypothetical protein
MIKIESQPLRFRVSRSYTFIKEALVERGVHFLRRGENVKRNTFKEKF